MYRSRYSSGDLPEMSKHVTRDPKERVRLIRQKANKLYENHQRRFLYCHEMLDQIDLMMEQSDMFIKMFPHERQQGSNTERHRSKDADNNFLNILKALIKDTRQTEFRISEGFSSLLKVNSKVRELTKQFKRLFEKDKEKRWPPSAMSSRERKRSKSKPKPTLGQKYEDLAQMVRLRKLESNLNITMKFNQINQILRKYLQNTVQSPARQLDYAPLEYATSPLSYQEWQSPIVTPFCLYPPESRKYYQRRYQTDLLDRNSY